MYEFLLSFVPFFESRYTLPILISLGYPPITTAVIVSALNMLAFPASMFFLDTIHHLLYRFRWYKQLFDKYSNKILKNKKKIDKYGYFGLFLFVFIPLPTTGVYSGSLLTWLLELDRKKAFLYMFLGVLSWNLLFAISYISGKLLF